VGRGKVSTQPISKVHSWAYLGFHRGRIGAVTAESVK
jgi:hypothetical protein